MKTATKIIISLAVIGVGVGAFVYLQSSPALNTQMDALRPSTRQSEDTGSSNGLGAGERPWVNQLDDEFTLAYRFRGEKFTPKSGSTVEVSKPSFQFFQSDGQTHELISMIEMSGETGVVTLPQRESKSNGKSPFSGSAASGMPTSGTMKDVTIKMYPMVGGKPAERPTLVATMDNVTFDNENLQIRTDAFTKDGREVPRDRVPVVVRGDEYDFDGEGLSMTIDGGKKSTKSRGTIERLKIDHAHSLLIKHPSSVEDGEKPTRARATPKPEVTPPSGEAMPAVPQPQVLTPAGPAPVATTTTSDAKGGARKIYRAIFTHDVKIVQGDSTITGERMQVDFSSRAGSAGNVAISPVPAPSAPASRSAPPESPRPAPEGLQGEVTPKVNVSPVAPSDAEKPVLITWDGPLDVQGNGGDPSLPDKQAIVTITGTPGGTPTVIKQSDMMAQTSTLVYDKLARLATLTGADGKPVVLAGKDNAVASTPKLTYDARGRVATFLGSSFVRGQRLGEDGKTQVPVTVSWTDKGTFVLDSSRSSKNPASDAGDAGRLKSAVLEGGVAVEDPGLVMNSRKLAVDFDLTAKKSNTKTDAFGGAKIQTAHAEGDVVATIPGKNGERDARLQGDDLVFATALDDNGRRNPGQIVSKGNVRATDGKSDLATDLLVLDVEPKAKAATTNDGSFNAIRVKMMSADGKVHATTDDGIAVVTDKMRVKDATDAPDITLEGPNSSVAGKGDEWKLLAEHIRYLKNDKTATIRGPGVMTGTQKGKNPGDAETPFKVTWADSAKMDNDANRVDVVGKVRLETEGKDGATDTATGDALTVNLVPKAKPPGAVTRKAKPSDAQAAMSDKDVKSFDFTGHVALLELLTRGDEVVKQMNLWAEKMTYEATRGLTVPAPGRIFFYDRTAERKAPNPDDKTPSGKGTSVIEWKDNMFFDRAKNTVEFTGNVGFAHRPVTPADNADPKTDDLVKLHSDRMVATLAPNKEKTADPSAPTDAAQLKSVSAYDNVRFEGRDIVINARQLDFDPVGQVIVCQGTERDPVDFEKSRGAGRGTATYMRFNLKSGQIEEVRNPTGTLGSAGLSPGGGQKKPK